MGWYDIKIDGRKTLKWSIIKIWSINKKIEIQRRIRNRYENKKIKIINVALVRLITRIINAWNT